MTVDVRPVVLVHRPRSEVAAFISTGMLAASTPAGRVAASHHGVGVRRAAFDNPRPNPYFPLRPGTVSRYRGSEGHERFFERVTVAHRMRTIQGVRTATVLDVLRRADGTLKEKTHDWYAADNQGNVWYVGQATPTTSMGRWRAGTAARIGGARRGGRVDHAKRDTAAD